MILKTTRVRLSFFSDAIFAVLIMMLLLDLRPPERATFEALLPSMLDQPFKEEL